jgi:hypothetical protein
VSSSENIRRFEDAVVAFEVQFESQLASRWGDLEKVANKAGSNAGPSDRLDILDRFFDRDLADATGAVIHEYFPRLLGVATAQRQYIGDRLPLVWTKAQILTQTCRFLGIDEEFDATKDPAQHSRVLRAAERVISYWLPPKTTGVDEESDDAFIERVVSDWATEAAEGGFLLPWWVDRNLRMVRALAGQPFASWSGADTETLSRAATLEWVKLKEHELWERLKLNIEDEGWEAIIEAGKTGVSALEGCVSSDIQEREPAAHNRFVKEGETWAISFAGEICKLAAPMIGLDYILVLLQNPGVEIRAMELQTVLAANPVESRPASKCAADSITEDAEDEDDRSSSSQTDFSRSEYLDYHATLKCKARMLELEELTTQALEIDDKQTAEAWQKEYDEIDSYLNRSRNVRGQTRVFAGENENARTSITKALARAYSKIQRQAPKTADHLRSQIKTGTKFVYQDGSTSWEL